jgi:hypothetical protein
MRKIFLFLMFVLSACTQHNQFETSENDLAIVDQLPEDFPVPQVVWDSMKSKNPDEKEKPIIYTSVKLFLKEKNKGVLKKSLFAYEFARGGGELDLSTVLGPYSGTFFLGFELPEFENVYQKKVFFISESRQRKVDDEILGSGCNKVLDISTEFFKKNKDKGIEINTTRSRQDSILGGHLIFLAETEKNWLLTQVTFFDSSRTDLFCKGFRVAAGVN